MPVKIEIVGEANGSIEVALYYPVPNNMYNPMSIDLERIQAGNALSAQEIIDLKEGRIFEYVVNYPTRNRSANKLKEELEKLWQDSIPKARSLYKQANSYTGIYLDNIGWKTPQ